MFWIPRLFQLKFTQFVASKLRVIFLKICGQIPAHVYKSHVPHCDFARQGGARAENIRGDTTTHADKTLKKS